MPHSFKFIGDGEETTRVFGNQNSEGVGGYGLFVFPVLGLYLSVAYATAL